jgi:putative tricarboxylic transport membrane protein
MDIIVMLSFGIIGYLMRRFDLNTAAVVLALILGPIGEKGLRNALRISQGDPRILFSSAVCWVLIVLCILGILSPILMNRLEKKAEKDARENVPADSEIE